MSDFCTEDVPVLMRRRNFCSSFAADARDFRTYNSWVLSLMLNQVPPAPDPKSCMHAAALSVGAQISYAVMSRDICRVLRCITCLYFLNYCPQPCCCLVGGSIPCGI